MFEFSVFSYTRVLREKTAPKFFDNSKKEPAASYRRAFRLAVFNIFKTGAVDMDMLQPDRLLKGLETAYRKLRLPFADIKSSEFEKWEEFVESIGSHLTSLKLTIDVQYTEAVFHRFWVLLFSLSYTHASLFLPLELSINCLYDMYRAFRLDFSVCLTYAKPQYLPILAVELSRLPLYHCDIAHKDEDKLALIMGASLLKLVGRCHHLGEKMVADLIVFGLLLGGTDFEVCLMYPDFAEQDLKGPGVKLRNFTMVFRTSRSSWRFRLVGGDYAYMDHNKQNDFSCAGSSINYDQPPEPGQFNNSNQTVEDIPDEMAYALGDFEEMEPSEASPIYTMEAISGMRNFATLKKYFGKEFQKEELNLTGMLAFQRLAQLVAQEAAWIEAELRKNPGKGPDNSYRYPDSRIKIMFQGRTGSSSASSKGKRTAKAASMPPHSPTQSKSKRPRQWPHEQGDSAVISPKLQPISVAETDELKQMVDTVIIEKRGSAYEVDVYESRAVMQSALFPRLLDFKYDDRTDLVSLKLEKLVPMREFNLTLSHLLETSAKAQFMLSKLLLDIMGALRILHLTGFVHCDVSPDSVSFNLGTGTWQLFDSIEHFQIAQTEPHPGENRGFRSRRYEQTGLFRPLGDYILLALTFSERFVCWNKLVP